MLSPGEKKRLEALAWRIRLLTMHQIGKRGFGHAGGALSIADLLAVLYGRVMHYRSADPEWEGRDRLICSKGHAGPALYAALSLSGFFPIEWLDTLNQPGTRLPSHCDRLLTPGIDMTTGSLGQGFSAAVGQALGLSLRGMTGQVFTIVGDGELNEGQIWEAAMFASHRRLNRLIAFCDWNKKQLDGDTSKVLDIPNIAERFAAFGWLVWQIGGHDLDTLVDTIEAAQQARGDCPRMIILDTVKGSGVPLIESMEPNHHVVLTAEQTKMIIEKLNSHVWQLEQEAAAYD